MLLLKRLPNGMGLYTFPRCNSSTTKRRSDVDRGRVLSCGKSGCKGTHAQSGTTQYRYFQKLNDHSWSCFAEFWQDMGSSWPGPGAGLRKRDVGLPHGGTNSYWADNKPEPEVVRRRNEFLRRKGRTLSPSSLPKQDGTRNQNDERARLRHSNAI